MFQTEPFKSKKAFRAFVEEYNGEYVEIAYRYGDGVEYDEGMLFADFAPPPSKNAKSEYLTIQVGPDELFKSIHWEDITRVLVES